MFKSFGQKLRELRQSKKLSQSEVETELKLPERTVSKYERDIYRPSGERLKEIAKLYGVSIEYFLQRELGVKNLWQKVLERNFAN